jgi:hypothetical protein
MKKLILLLVCLPLAAGEPVTLVDRGQARAIIVAGDKEAAAELAGYIERVTGARLPDSGSLPARVLVGAAACPTDVRARIGKLPPDGFLIETRPGGVLVLAGNGRDGTAFAVYEFLERYAGVRWLWPGNLGEIVPRAASLKVPAVSEVRQPAFVWRNLGPGGALWGKLDKLEKERELGVSVEHQRLQALWARRNRFGGEIVFGGHAFGSILPPEKYAATHPEYYALVNGKRAVGAEKFDGKHGLQPCTTHPDVIRLTIEYCRRLFQQHPEYDAVSISPNDGRAFCECDRCRRLDTGRTMEARKDPEGGRGGAVPILSDRMMTFANQVADGVQATNPGKKVLIYAYGQYIRPPDRVVAKPEVIVQYTNHALTWWKPELARTAGADLSGWSRHGSSLGVYEYFTQGNCPDMPRLFPQLIERSARRLEELGFRYYQTQAGDGYALNGLNFYLLGKLLWNPRQDAAALERDYIEKGFGAAAPDVARYFGRLEAAWRAADPTVGMDDARPESYRRMLATYPRDLRRACRKDLEAAARAASGQDAERVRFLQAGLRYFEMTMEATEKTLPLLEAGWNLSRRATAPAKPDRPAFDASLAAWEARDRYIESLRDDFVVSYLWIRYNDQQRTYNPLAAMRNYRKAQ